MREKLARTTQEAVVVDTSQFTLLPSPHLQFVEPREVADVQPVLPRDVVQRVAGLHRVLYSLALRSLSLDLVLKFVPCCRAFQVYT